MTGQRIEGISSNQETVNPLGNIEINNREKTKVRANPLVEGQVPEIESRNQEVIHNVTESRQDNEGIPENYNQGGSGLIRQVWNEKNGDTPPSSGY